MRREAVGGGSVSSTLTADVTVLIGHLNQERSPIKRGAVLFFI